MILGILEMLVQTKLDSLSMRTGVFVSQITSEIKKKCVNIEAPNPCKA